MADRRRAELRDQRALVDAYEQKIKVLERQVREARRDLALALAHRLAPPA